MFPDCIQQNYGDDCSLPCSEFCVDGRCNSSNGVCLQGCQPGYLGSHCNRSKNIHITLISTCMYKFSKYRLVNLSLAIRYGPSLRSGPNLMVLVKGTKSHGAREMFASLAPNLMVLVKGSLRSGPNLMVLVKGLPTYTWRTYTYM